MEGILGIGESMTTRTQRALQPPPTAWREVSILACTLLIALGSSGDANGFERSETREPCAARDPLRQPRFGDLHVHSSFSFDSWTSGQRNDPSTALAFARGEPILLPDLAGEQTVRVQLRRPLDFASITDHSELLGEMNLCTAYTAADGSHSWAWWTPRCLMTRSSSFLAQLLSASYWVSFIGNDTRPDDRSYVCRWFPEACADAELGFWQALQDAAEQHYDRSSACEFTSFVGYEYTDTVDFANLHRNVIFRNEHVPERPISAIDTGSQNPAELWRRLREECIESDTGCDVLSIPHNSNLARGLMFPDPASEQEARERLFFEPVVELIQHKAASECRFDRLAGRGLDTADELCSFEQNKTDTLLSLAIFQGEVQSEAGMPVSLDDFARRNMIRNVLKDGLALGQRDGLNPFQMGFIGSTDTHNAIPGATDEDAYVGHLGRRDTDYRNIQDHFQDNPGGLAVVWSEENSRDSIFEAIRRKETYATSGTRPVVRFFGGWSYDESLCSSPEWTADGYREGVPMGGRLSERPGEGAPRFLVSALKDPGTEGRPGTDLERVQIVKGWVDADGSTHEAVYDVAGQPNPAASVDPLTCEPTGRGAASLCTVWEDPSFDPTKPAFWYVRVLENPTCRWSTLHCMAAGVNPFAPSCEASAVLANEAARDLGATGKVYDQCCVPAEDQPFLSPVIQERAWTSPIWYRPEPATSARAQGDQRIGMRE
jgi:hypothetical protein